MRKSRVGKFNMIYITLNFPALDFIIHIYKTVQCGIISKFFVSNFLSSWVSIINFRVVLIFFMVPSESIVKSTYMAGRVFTARFFELLLSAEQLDWLCCYSCFGEERERDSLIQCQWTIKWGVSEINGQIGID